MIESASFVLNIFKKFFEYTQNHSLSYLLGRRVSLKGSYSSRQGNNIKTRISTQQFGHPGLRKLKMYTEINDVLLPSLDFKTVST